MNTYDACFNLHFATSECSDPIKSHDDPLYFASEGHADPPYHAAVGSSGAYRDFHNEIYTYIIINIQGFQ